MNACQYAGRAVTDLTGAFGLEDSLRRLEEAQASLSERDIVFGSPGHIESLADSRRPLSDELLQVVRSVDDKLADSGRRVTVFDLLEALIGPSGPLSEKAMAIELSVTALRAASDTSGGS